MMKTMNAPTTARRIREFYAIVAVDVDGAGPYNAAVVQIPRARGLSPEQFLAQYAAPGRPAIIEGLIDRWPALHRWTPDFWRSRFGTRLVSTDEGELSMAALVDAALASTEVSPAPYLRSELLDDFEGLAPDVQPSPALCEPNWYRGALFRVWNPFARIGNETRGRYELFIGGAGRAFPYVHYDAPGTHTFIHQLQGRKRLLLFAPDQSDALYPESAAQFHLSRIADVEHVPAAEFPQFASATPWVAELGPGDTLFLPAGWWHFARMQSFSVSIAVDVLNETSWASVRDFMARKRRHGAASPLAAAWLRVIGLRHGQW